MNNFDEMLKNATEEELEELKTQLFFENVRMQAEQKKIEGLYRKFEAEKEQFQRDRKLSDRTFEFEKKRLESEQIFFEKKFAILQNAFQQLEVDRRSIEQEKKSLYKKDRRYTGRDEYSYVGSQTFFKGVDNILTLKKRYKDLIKIFHPDNLCGDTDTVQMINKEYDMLRNAYEYE